MENKTIIKGYELEKSIGKGAFGEVFLATVKGNEKKFAVKVMDKEKCYKTEKDKKYIDQEINILKICSHPNILKYVDHILDSKDDKIYIITEFINGYTLGEYLDKYENRFKKPNLSQEAVQFIARQIVSALYYLHEQNIIHRDIKLNNIMIDFKTEEDKEQLNIRNSTFKIIDFGTSKKLGRGELATTFCGTPQNMDPRILKLRNNLDHINEPGYDLKADIWSLGTVIYELLIGKPIFDAFTMEELKKEINKKYEIPKGISISVEAISFLNGVLQFDHEKRFNIKDVKNHYFLTRNINSFKSIEIKNLVLDSKKQQIWDKKEYINISPNMVESDLDDTNLISNRLCIPIIGNISVGKSTFINSILGIDLLESKEATCTKFINILRYNPNLSEPKFYHAKIIFDFIENRYLFYKDENFQEVLGAENIKKTVEKINENLSNQKQDKYDELFYFTELKYHLFTEESFLLNHDILDVPGVSEYKTNQGNSEENKLGGIYSLISYVKSGYEQIKNYLEDEAYYQIDLNEFKNYLTEIFKVLKYNMDGGIMMFSTDNYYDKSNIDMIVILKKIIDKPLQNMLLILNKIDLSRNPQDDIQKFRSYIISEFSKGTTFNINDNLFLAINSKNIKNEVLIQSNFENLIFYYFENYKEEAKKKDGLSFFDYLEKIIFKNKSQKQRLEEIDSRIRDFFEINEYQKIKGEIHEIFDKIPVTDESLFLDMNSDEIYISKEEMISELDDYKEGDQNEDIFQSIPKVSLLFILYDFFHKKQNLPDYSKTTKKLFKYFKEENDIKKNIKKRQEMTKIVPVLINDIEKIANEYIINSNLLCEQIPTKKFYIENILNLNNKFKEYIYLDDFIYISLAGLYNSGKSTILNDLIGKDILPTGDNNSTKNIILIRYWDRDDVIIRQIQVKNLKFKEGRIEKLYYNFLYWKNVIAVGEENVKNIIKDLNHGANNTNVYVIYTRIKVLDELKVKDKEKYCLIDLPGYKNEKENQKNEELFKIAFSASTSIIFVILNMKADDSSNVNFIKNLYERIKNDNFKTLDELTLKKILFVVNTRQEGFSFGANLQELEKERQKLAEILEVNSKNIKLSLFNAKFYENYLLLCKKVGSLQNMLHVYYKEYKIYLKQKERNPDNFINFINNKLKEEIKNKFIPNAKADEIYADKKQEDLFCEYYKNLAQKSTRIQTIKPNNPKIKEILKNFNFISNNLVFSNYYHSSNYQYFSQADLLEFFNISKEINDNQSEERLTSVLNLLDFYFDDNLSYKSQSQVKIKEFSKLYNRKLDEFSYTYLMEYSLIKFAKEQIGYFRVEMENYKKEIQKMISIEKTNWKVIEEKIKQKLLDFKVQLLDKLKSKINEANEECNDLIKYLTDLINEFGNDGNFISQKLKVNGEFKDYLSRKLTGKETASMIDKAFSEVIKSGIGMNPIWKKQGFFLGIASKISDTKYFDNEVKNLLDSLEKEITNLSGLISTHFLVYGYYIVSIYETYIKKIDFAKDSDLLGLLISEVTRVNLTKVRKVYKEMKNNIFIYYQSLKNAKKL